MIPCVDLMGGRAVRLLEGDPNRETRYHDDPLEAALLWHSQGASLLHLVDLDAATGRGDNRAVLARLAQHLQLPFEVGGGVRSLPAARELLALGAQRVVVGTLAVKDPAALASMLQELGPQRVVVSLDARGLEVVVSGWQEGTAFQVPQLTQQLADLGLTTLIYTDVRRDGTLQGLDLEMVARVRQAWPGVLIAGGGIAADADLEGLQSLGVEGAIVGKALYEGRIHLPDWTGPHTG